MERIKQFAKLGERVDNLLQNQPERLEEWSRIAAVENPWFTPESIRMALGAISRKMLREEKLRKWAARYPYSEGFVPKKIGIVMAGNIPWVGFFDLLSVWVSGHTPYVKFSSKDRILNEYLLDMIREIDPALPFFPLTDSLKPDAVIATGSDNAKRHFKHLYGDIPHLLRGSRTSVAVLHGDESDEQLEGLWHDLFDYFGMGCRNVSKLFLPEGYDVQRLAERLRRRTITHPKYRHAYMHRKALLQMHGAPFTDAGFFLLREVVGLSETLPEVLYSYYDDPEAVNEWLRFNDEAIQCVVTETIAHPRAVAYGESQQPELGDYPDGADVMAFLRRI